MREAFFKESIYSGGISTGKLALFKFDLLAYSSMTTFFGNIYFYVILANTKKRGELRKKSDMRRCKEKVENTTKCLAGHTRRLVGD